MIRAAGLLSAVLVSGCVFDKSGPAVPGGSDAAGLDQLQPDVTSDLPLPSNPCEPPQTGNVCRFESQTDVVGQAGTCKGNVFDETSPYLRNCFSVAACNEDTGQCQPLCSADCPKQACPQGQVCTLFFVGQTGHRCCVTPNPLNGAKVATDSCQSNTDCKSGLCTLEGNCFEPCVGQCEGGLVCGLVVVREGDKEMTVYGCKKPTPEAGADAGLDSGPDAQVGDDAALEVGPDVASGTLLDQGPDGGPDFEAKGSAETKMG
jgi:hypothetical protein